MRLIFLTLTFLLCLTNNSFTQHPVKSTSSTFVYKITNEEAKTIYTDKENQYKSTYFEKYCYNLLDSFPNPKDEINYDYDFGYYLVTKTIGEKNQIDVKAVHDIFVKEMDDENEFVLQVFDSSFHIVTDAKVYLEDKEISFDANTKSFRKKLKKEKGIVTIVANGQTIYYDYNVTKNKKSRNIFSRYRYISFRSVGRRIIRPFTGNGIFARTFKKLAMKPHKGYIAVSQPKYRHNDTVKVKAYIAKPNGRPINKEIEVRLYENSVSKYNIKYYKPISKATIQSDLDGNYKHEFVLGDSLKIDKTYYTAFIKKTNRKNKKVYFKQGFRLEDYELDKIDYSFEPTQTKYHAQEKIILKASAKDQNNNHIPDGTLKITVLSKEVETYYEDQVWIKDTLWQETIDMKHSGETQIIIPWDSIPAVKMKVSIVADMYNSNGEFQRFKKNLTLDNKQTILKTRQEGEYVIA